MDLDFTSKEVAFQEEVRGFLQDCLPADIREKVRRGWRLTKADVERWQGILSKRGWLAGHWPVEYGGQGWSAVERYIFDVEAALANAPRLVAFGFSMLAPVLLKFGSEQQRRYWLPRMLDGSDWWCQGYSEPGAGSDLAGLRTKAIRDGDHYVINGQKTWTSLGQHANMMFCLARTTVEAKKQDGISFILVDMKAPGVEVRPIITLDGDHEVNEVFFDNVRAPIANLVGEEGKGWTYAKYLLTYERTAMALIGTSSAALDLLKEIASRQYRRGKPLADDAYFAMRLARVEIELENLKTTTLRVLAAAVSGAAPGAESSILKVKGVEVRQELTGLMRRALGPHAVAFLPDVLEGDADDMPHELRSFAGVTPAYLNSRKLSILGGSNEVQKNIISKTILNL